jgi:hypothetical protein
VHQRDPHRELPFQRLTILLEDPLAELNRGRQRRGHAAAKALTSLCRGVWIAALECVANLPCEEYRVQFDNPYVHGCVGEDQMHTDPPRAVDLDEKFGILDAPRMRRRSWAHLLARVFSIDVTTCPCGGRLKIVQVVLGPDEIALHQHGARAPPRQPPLGQLSLLPP